MTLAQWIVLVTYSMMVAAWPIRHLAITIIISRFDILTTRSPRPDPGSNLPWISAIIPAKDEESTLADCLASVCAQTYPNLEILVVDDRSTDRTSEIALEFAARDPRVRLITITHLPPGWTGKNHALHEAASEARGQWLWLIDSDTRHHPDSLAIVYAYALRHNAALASLVPEMRCESFWEKLLQPLEGIVLMRSFPLFSVNNDRSPMAFANGQYILVSRSAYDASGGHSAVRDRFVEDIFMARRVKALGLPIRVAIGTEISSTRMYTSLPQIVRGWSRILYDALDRRALPIIGKVLEPLIFSQTGDVALIVALVLLATGSTTPFTLWLLGLSVVHQLLKVSVLYRMYRLTAPKSAGYAVWYSLAGLVSDWIFLKSLEMCRTGQVQWRGTAYGLNDSPANTAPSPSVPPPSACHEEATRA